MCAGRPIGRGQGEEEGLDGERVLVGDAGEGGVGKGRIISVPLGRDARA